MLSRDAVERKRPTILRHRRGRPARLRARARAGAARRRDRAAIARARSRRRRCDRARGARRVARDSSSTPARTRRSTAPKRERELRIRGQRARARRARRRGAALRRGADPLLDRLRVRRHARRRRTTRTRRPIRSTSTARASSPASRRSRAAARCADAAHELGLRPPRQQFPADDAAARRASATSCASSPTRSARRTGAARSPTRRADRCGAGLRHLAERAGLYHLSAHGRGDLVRVRARDRRRRERPRDRPIATADYPTPARRPAYGVLDRRALHARSASRSPTGAMLAECLRAPAEPPAGFPVN